MSTLEKQPSVIASEERKKIVEQLKEAEPKRIHRSMCKAEKLQDWEIFSNGNRYERRNRTENMAHW